MFLPRSLQKKKPKPNPSPFTLSVPPTPPAQTAPEPSSSHPPAPHSITLTDTKDVDQLADHERVILLEWLMTDTSLLRDEHDMEILKWMKRKGGFVSLSSLISAPSPLVNHPLFTPPPPPNGISRAIRLYGTPNFLKTRLSLDEPKRWGSTKGVKEGLGGIEVGREGYGQIGLGPAKSMEGNEVYLENFPPSIKSFPQAYLFLVDLLPSQPPSHQPILQNLSLHPTQSLSNSSAPTSNQSTTVFRHYAWVTIDDSATRNYLLLEWNWEGAKDRAREDRKRSSRRGKGVEVPDKGEKPVREEEEDEGEERSGHAGDERADAKRAGFRALERTRYESLEQEYINMLISSEPVLSSASSEPISRATPSTQPPPSASSRLAPNPSFFLSKHPPLATSSYAPSSIPSHRDYPTNCLLFLKNLSPETSKTALKDILNAILSSPVLPPPSLYKGKREVSYVDWLKGSDSAHIRLPHPSLAPPILSHFSSQQLYHLPASSSVPLQLSDEPPEGDGGEVTKAVEAELVEGERERIYWMGRVKEGLRRKAVEDIAAAGS